MAQCPPVVAADGGSRLNAVFGGGGASGRDEVHNLLQSKAASLPVSGKRHMQAGRLAVIKHEHTRVKAQTTNRRGKAEASEAASLQE